MKDNSVDYRLVENEVIFRTFNENVQKRFDELNRIALDDNQVDVITETDIPLHFYCECSDEKCRERIQLKPETYNAIHKDRSQFIIVPEHNVVSIEEIVTKEGGYWIVKKHFLPSEQTADGLNETDLQNT